MSSTFVSGHGSQQLRLLRRGLRDGLSVEQAAERAGYDLHTARLVAADDLKNPPPEAAYQLLYLPGAPADASSNKEAAVAKDEEGAGEYHRPDAALAFKIYDTTIKPKEAHLATIKGDMSEPYQNIKDQAHFPRKVLNFIVGLENEEDAKRDHMLLALSEGLKHRQLFLPRDLVTMANGEEQSDIVGTEDRDDDDLLVDQDDDEEADQLPLAAAGKDAGFSEASDEEIGQQEGRKPRRTARPKADADPAPSPSRGRPASVTSIAPLKTPGSEARAH